MKFVGRPKLHRLVLGVGLMAVALVAPTWAATGKQASTAGQEQAESASMPFVSDLSDIPADLAYMQAHKVPMMLFFHASYCGYCKMIDSQFITPMRFDPEYRGRLLIRRVQVDAKETYIGRDGKAHDYLSLANRLEVRGVPYVLFIAPNGKRITSITGTAPGFYNYYLSRDARLAEDCAKNMNQKKCQDLEKGPGL